MPSSRLKYTTIISISFLILGLMVLCGLFFSGAFDPSTEQTAEQTSEQTTQEPLTYSTDQGYMGTQTCAGCHQKQFQDWSSSHHDQAMQHASEATVKGDFNNTTFNGNGNSALFLTKQDGFYARLAGTDNQVDDYKILYTFGTEPLQQYLVAFPNGRLQQLPVAWNTLTQEWFDPQPALKAVADEWVHWSKGGKNWNSMCADCHSSNVEKNFNPVENSYSTRISELNVGCESCHGPGEKHIKTVEVGTFKAGTDNPHIDMMTNENPQILVDKCGRCHARRQQLTSKFEHGSNQLLDHYLPSVLASPLYHSDGQILDEVFVYGSFIQSKMYHSNVGCVNCHEPHSAKLKAEGNQLCVGCHSREQFDTPEHHHHSAGGSITGTPSQGNQCIDCHMPGKLYMGNDYRRDHSFRIPRPDHSVAHGTPNACNTCHTEQSAAWAAEKVVDWFGKARPAHFSETLTQAASNPSQSLEPLMALLNNLSEPAIARATAVSTLAPAITTPSIERAVTTATADKSALVRTLAAQALIGSANKVEPLILLLNDPVRSVRIAAAQALVDVPEGQIPARYREAYSVANREYQTSLQVNADFPSGRHQIAVDRHRRGNLNKATEHYLETLHIDNHFNTARLNLAQLYYSQQNLKEAENLYRAIIAQESNASDAYYSLGLLMAEQGDYKQAAIALENAAVTGNNPRAWYNLAVLYQQRGRALDSEKTYLKALAIAPENPEFINGLASLYAQQQRWNKALKLVDGALVTDPKNTSLLQLKQAIERSSR